MPRSKTGFVSQPKDTGRSAPTVDPTREQDSTDCEQNLTTSNDRLLEAGNLSEAEPEFEDGFDEVFYLATYPDVAAYNEGPRAHFNQHGRREGRYGTERALLENRSLLIESGKFDFAYYKLMNGYFLDPVRDFLLNASERVDPEEDFDRAFVATYYPESLAANELPFTLYCRAHEKNWFYRSFRAVEDYVTTLKSSKLFSERHMRAELPDLASHLDLATYYCTEGFRLYVDPSPAFSTRGYVLDNPDIAETAINPLVHYIRHGEGEGRTIITAGTIVFEKGLRRHESGKPTLLVISHEASRSGAPIVGLNLARTLCTTYNIVSVLMRRGEIYDHFLKFSTDVVVSGDSPGRLWLAVDALTARMSIDAAILNSIECTKFLPSLVDHQVPTISLVHEFPQYCYPFFLHAKAIALSNLVVYPAKVVRDEAFVEMERLGLQSKRVRNVVLASQGRPVVPPSYTQRDHDGVPPSIQRRLAAAKRPFVVLGAGWVQPRKGVDLFIEAARIARHELNLDCIFIWVGANFDPERDLSLSVYLADQVEQSGLGNVVHFVEEQSTLQPFWDIADLFFVSSRLDPFPNVAIDAIAEGIPVICFNRATGIAELSGRWPDRVIAVAYNATAEIARTVETLLRSRVDGAAPVRIPPTPELKEFISFQRYADFLSSSVQHVIVDAATRKAIAGDLHRDLRFDAAFFSASLPWWMKSAGSIVAPTKTSLAAIAALSVMNGVEIGYLWPGKITRDTRPQSRHESARLPSFDIRSIPVLTQYKSNIAYAAVVFVNDPATVQAFCEHVLLSGQVSKVGIVGTGLLRMDLELLKTVIGQESLLVLDSSEAGAVHEQLLSEFATGMPVHVISTSFEAEATTATDEPLNLSESSMRAAFDTLVSSNDLQIVLQKPVWSKKRRLKRYATLPDGTSLISERLVDVSQCYCKLGRDTWSSHFLLGLVENTLAYQRRSLWDVVEPFVRNAEAASCRIVSPRQTRSNVRSELLST